MNKLLEYLPIHLRLSQAFKEIMETEQIEFEKISLDIEDLEKQLFVDTATWGLAIYEKELELKIDIDKPLEGRRSSIKAKWRGLGKVGSNLIKALIDSYTNGGTNIDFDGEINIGITNVNSTYINLGDIESTIKDVKPAHLPHSLTMKFKTKTPEIITGCTCISGETITIRPKVKDSIEMNDTISNLVIGNSTEKIKVYPRLVNEINLKANNFNAPIVNFTENITVYPNVINSMMLKTNSFNMLNMNLTEELITYPRKEV